MISKKMRKSLPDIIFSEKQISGLRSIVSRKYPQMDHSSFDQKFFQQTVQKRIVACRLDNFDAYLELLDQQPSEVTFFYNTLYVNYTEFFRNPLTFALFESVIFPDMIKRQAKKKTGELRIWSAACADGREAYSIAMLLEELKQKAGTDFKYRIFATDIAQPSIELAKSGVYPEPALGNLSYWRVKRWFSHSGDQFAIKSELKYNIDFSVFDLFDEELNCPAASIYGDFDLVFCANLLFYYNQKVQSSIIEKMLKCIKESGFLVTSESERAALVKFGLIEAFPYSAIFRNNRLK